MVGVPHSKGCSLCVKRRVKCDQAVPGAQHTHFHVPPPTSSSSEAIQPVLTD